MEKDKTHYYFVLERNTQAYALEANEIIGEGAYVAPHYVEGRESAFKTAKSLATRYGKFVSIHEDSGKLAGGSQPYAGWKPGEGEERPDIASLMVELKERGWKSGNGKDNKDSFHKSWKMTTVRMHPRFGEERIDFLNRVLDFDWRAFPSEQD